LPQRLFQNDTKPRRARKNNGVRNSAPQFGELGVTHRKTLTGKPFGGIIEAQFPQAIHAIARLLPKKPESFHLAGDYSFTPVPPNVPPRSR